MVSSRGFLVVNSSEGFVLGNPPNNNPIESFFFNNLCTFLFPSHFQVLLLNTSPANCIVPVALLIAIPIIKYYECKKIHVFPFLRSCVPLKYVYEAHVW